jgi:hypothetical protein
MLTDYWPTPWMFFGPVIMLQFAIGCMTMMFFMMRDPSTRSHVEILKVRYARGAITRTEFDERRRLLRP